MTLNELSNEICALGFDNYAKPDMPLVFAARRALTAIYGELRITEEAGLYVASHTPSSKIAKFHHKGGGAESLPLSGKAYAMTVSGIGSVTIFDGSITTKTDFNSNKKTIKGFLKGNGRADFSGEASFDVYNIATYDEVSTDQVYEIPDGDNLTKICVKEKIENFGGFASPLTDSEGKIIESAKLIDGRITLPVDFSGEITLTYRRVPMSPTLSDTDEQIDIPKEYEAILPLLTAFYILLDDDEEKAQIYKNSYTESLNSIKKMAYSLSGKGYADVSGWGK